MQLLPTISELKKDRRLPARTKSAVSALTDEQLLKESIAVDPDLYAELVARYQEPFLRKARSILRNHVDAEDATQEAFVKMYIKGKTFKVVEGASFRSWAYRILINTCLTAYRKKARARMYVLAEDLEELPPSILQASAEATVGSALKYDEFLSIISRLPQKFASLLRDLVMAGESLKKLAEREGVSVGAMRTRLHRARRAFRNIQMKMSLNEQR